MSYRDAIQSDFMQLKYRADIDGLRAVAVLVVLFFHARIPGFSGGFVGVDVFFVISGFLITSIILKDIHAGQFSIARFYERRIRRIFPALFPVIAFTFVVGAFLFDPIAFRAFGESIITTALFASNYFFWLQSGYFDAASITKPLLHTWSLAVEEQFYIFFPLLLIAINRFSKSRYLPWIAGLALIPSAIELKPLITEMYGLDNVVPRQVVVLLFFLLYVSIFPLLYNVLHRFSKNRYLPWLIGIGLISLFTNIYGVYISQGTTFYLVPTRAWELLLGSFLALDVMPLIQSNIQRNIVSIIGLVLIAFSVVFYTEATLFPGIAALAPVIGSGLIIYSGMENRSIVSKFLSLKPVVYIGLISYSLYLWHWPLIVFAKYLIVRDLTPVEIIGIFLLSFLVSSLSLKFIEGPFRGNQPIIPDRKKLFALSALVMVIASIIGSIIYFQKGIIPYRYSEERAALKRLQDDVRWEDTLQKVVTIENFPITRIGGENISPSFIIWGDSHAISLLPGIDEKGKAYGLSGFAAATEDRPPLLGIDSSVDFGSEKTHIYTEGVLSFIKSHTEVKTVILAGMWAKYVNGHRYKDTFRTNLKGVKEAESHLSNLTLFKIGLTKTVNTILALGRKVILVTDVPEIGYPVPKLFWINKSLGQNIDNELPTIAIYRYWNKDVDNVLRELSQSQNVSIIHPESMMFDKNGKVIIIANKQILYRDGHHLSIYGARYVSPVFDDFFKKNRSTPGQGLTTIDQ